jgi:hypothetical protein
MEPLYSRVEIRHLLGGGQLSFEADKMPSDLDEKDATNATVTPATPAVKTPSIMPYFIMADFLVIGSVLALGQHYFYFWLTESRNYSFLSFLSSSVLHRLLESHSATPSGLKFGARNSG